MKKIHLFLIIGMLVSSMAYSQLTVVNLDASSNGQVFSYDSTNTVSVHDNGLPISMVERAVMLPETTQSLSLPVAARLGSFYN